MPRTSPSAPASPSSSRWPSTESWVPRRCAGPEHVPAHPVRGEIDIVGAGDCRDGQPGRRAGRRREPARGHGARHGSRLDRHPPARNHRNRLDRTARRLCASTTDSRKDCLYAHVLDRAFLVCATARIGHPRPPPEEPLVEKYLLEGKLAEGEKALAEAADRQTDGRASPLRSGSDPVRACRRADGPDVSSLWPALRRCRRHAAVRPAPHPRESYARADSLRRSARPVRAMDRAIWPGPRRRSPRSSRRTSSCRFTSA